MQVLITDQEIIERYRTGEKNVFEQLIEKYTPLVFNFAAHLAGRENASDIVQETFIKVWKNFMRFDPKKASLKTWILAIARNTAIDFLKKKKNILFSELTIELETEFAETIPDSELLPDEALARLEDASLLQKLLGELSPEYRATLVLHYQEEMTFEEIGKVLGKPLNTVKSYHRRALIGLRKMVK